MSRFTLAGRIETALTHFALVGLAGIVSESRRGPVRLAWTEDLEPRAVLTSKLSAGETAAVVHEHALRHTMADSWLTQRVSSGVRAGSGTFTARAKVPAETEWPAYAAERRRARRALALQNLDERLLTSLGEPAWWLVGVQGRSPDDGSSRWEMRTRNHGQEFIVDRFSRLAAALAAREVAAVGQGLIGERVIDETASNPPKSRTATGFTTPGPVDTSLAWCALWGIHAMPTVHRLSAVSQSAGVWPRVGVHPRVAVLPVFTAPVSPRRFSEIVGCPQLDIAGAELAEIVEARVDPLNAEASRRWLKDQGVRALVRFPILKIDNPSAPERQLLTGQLHPL